MNSDMHHHPAGHRFKYNCRIFYPAGHRLRYRDLIHHLADHRLKYISLIHLTACHRLRSSALHTSSSLSQAQVQRPHTYINIIQLVTGSGTTASYIHQHHTVDHRFRYNSIIHTSSSWSQVQVLQPHIYSIGHKKSDTTKKFPLLSVNI